jgi:hypothetical protein
MRRKFVGEHLRIQETLIWAAQGVSRRWVRQCLVSGRDIGISWVVRRGLENVSRELGDRGRMQNLRLCQQGIRSDLNLVTRTDTHPRHFSLEESMKYVLI